MEERVGTVEEEEVRRARSCSEKRGYVYLLSRGRRNCWTKQGLRDYSAIYFL